MGSNVPEMVSCMNFASRSLRTTINAKISERISEAFQAFKAGSCHEHRVLAHLFIFVLLQCWGEWSVLAGLSMNDSYLLWFFCDFYVMFRTKLSITHEWYSHLFPPDFTGQ